MGKSGIHISPLSLSLETSKINLLPKDNTLDVCTMKFTETSTSVETNGPVALILNCQNSVWSSVYNFCVCTNFSGSCPSGCNNLNSQFKATGYSVVSPVFYIASY